MCRIDKVLFACKLILIVDIVIPGHGRERLRMNVIPDKYDIEKV
jgi:hypothetical protein